jgi:hypothetical protein
MRRLVGLTLVLAITLSASSAFAQEDTKTKFYDFDDMLIDGQLKTPDLFKTKAREKAKFKRLLDLKKSFLPKVRESAEERALQ